MSKFIEKTLEEGETVVYKGRLHWTFNWHYTFGGAVLAILGAAMLYVGLSRPEPLFTVAGAVGLFAGLAFVGCGYIVRRKTTFAVTSHRFIQKDGILNIKMTEIPLFKIETVNLYQSLWQRLFSTGSLELVGSGGTCHRVDYVKSPFDLRKVLTTRMKATKDIKD